MTFNGLHGFISQKTELFITTGVKTSNPANIHDTDISGSVYKQRVYSRLAMKFLKIDYI
jgi:hypothetical protein